MGIILTDSIWCETGEHFWDREPTRGRVPKSCPEHKAQVKPSRREIKHRDRQQEIERVIATIERLKVRVEKATAEDDRVYAQMLARQDDDTFNLWLRGNVRLLGEVTALSTNEIRLERLQTERSQAMLDDEDDTLDIDVEDEDEEIEDEILAEFESDSEAA